MLQPAVIGHKTTPVPCIYDNFCTTCPLNESSPWIYPHPTDENARFAHALTSFEYLGDKSTHPRSKVKKALKDKTKIQMDRQNCWQKEKVSGSLPINEDMNLGRVLLHDRAYIH